MRRALIPFSVLTLALGCGGGDTGPLAPSSQAVDRLVQLADSAVSSDRQLLLLEQQVPGLGGMFRDASGQVTVLLTDLSRGPIAQQAIAAFYAGRNRADARTENVVMRQADYDIADLFVWKQVATRDLMNLPGAVSLDLDEVRNRVVLGVSDATAIAPIQAAIRKSGIPAGATIVEVATKAYPQSKLFDTYYTRHGGIQIGEAGHACTLGFNATMAVQPSTAVLVTAGHCSVELGSFDGGPIKQNGYASTVAYETWDPPFRTGNFKLHIYPYTTLTCPTGRICRRSDALLANYVSGFSWRKAIAYSDTIGHGRFVSGSLNWGGYYDVSGGDLDGPVIGDGIYKTGQATGSTFGTVSETCVLVNDSLTTKTLLCQHRAALTSAAGDSGSPYWFFTNNATTFGIAGIHWGGNFPPGYLSDTTTFSDFQGIQEDLGSLIPY